MRYLKRTACIFQKFFLILLIIFLTILVPGTALTAETAAGSPEMQIPPPGGNCINCHEPAVHNMRNCDLCHDNLAVAEPGSVITGGHGGFIVSDQSKLISTAPVGSCMVCHKYTNECRGCHPSYYNAPPPEMILDPNPRWSADYTHDASRINNYAGMDNTYDCEMCHVQDWWSSIPQHDQTTFGSVYSHVSSIAGCKSCHSVYLTTEHARHTNDNGEALDCFACHRISSPAPVRAAVRNSDTGCGACHNAVHGINTVPGVPDDVLLFPGLTWSPPQALAIWQKEPWTPEDTTGYQLLISGRDSSLTPNGVWTFYRDGLTSRGWSLVSPEPDLGGTVFSAAFTKYSRGVTLWYYSNETRSSQNSVPAGARIELIFK